MGVREHPHIHFRYNTQITGLDLRFSPFPYVAPGGHFQQLRMPLPWLP